MELSHDVQLLLDRCRTMNCIYEGQSFSRNLVVSACADPKSGEHALEEMLEKGLAVRTATGAYGLTSIGVSALQSSPKQTRRKTPHQNRPPINKI